MNNIAEFRTTLEIIKQPKLENLKLQKLLKKKIIFRADGSSSIGLGHVYRLLALAEFLSEEHECIFVTRNPSDFIVRQFNSLSIKHVILPHYDYPELDLRKPSEEVEFDLGQILNGDEIVVLDGYWFGSRYQQAVKDTGCKLVFIDDLNELDFKADVVISHSPAVSRKDYKLAPYTKLYLGFDYAVLRRPFLSHSVERPASSKERTLLLSFGGSDFYNLLEKSLIPICESNFWANINILVGSAYKVPQNLTATLRDFSETKNSSRSLCRGGQGTNVRL